MKEAQNVEIAAGETQKLVITISSEDASPVDLTGAAAEWNLTKHARASAPLLTKTTVGGGGLNIVNTAGVWTLELTLSAAETLALKPGTYWHDAAIRSGAGAVSEVMSGAFTVRPAFTPSHF